MIKRLKQIALAGAFCALSLTSCSDKETEFDKPFDEDFLKTGILSYAQNNIIEVPFKAAGEWSVSVPEDCDWVTVIDTEGKGNSVLSLVLDANIGGDMRTTTLSLTTGNETVDVKVSQYGVLEGVTAENGDQEDLTTRQTYQLGYGVNLLEYYDDPSVGISYKRTPLFNIEAFRKLMKTGNYEYFGLMSVQPRNNLTFQAANMDSIVDKRDSLGIAFSFNISYAKFKFGISGEYHGLEKLENHSLKLAYGAEYPTMDAGISYLDAIAHYDDYLHEETHEAQDFRKGILGTGFAKARKKLIAAVADTSKTADQVNTIVQDMIENYGSGVVVGSVLGGRVTMDLDMDSLYIKEEMRVDSATLVANLSLGAFELNAKVEVSYLNSSIDLLQHSRYKIDCAGGDPTLAKEMANALGNARYGTDLPTAINNWAKSISFSSDPDKNNSSLIEVDIIPIWVLFEDEAREAILNYVKSVYPDSKFLKVYNRKSIDNVAGK